MRIEDLPDELFLDIFCFSRPKDLFQGWYNLNSHVNAILGSVPISIEIKNNDDFDESLAYLYHFRSQMIYLKDERLLPHIQIDVSRLINVQYLYLNKCSNEQYKHIHPGNQPRLTRFSSSSVSWSFYEQILFGQERFPHLISIGCPRGASILLLNVAHPINTKLRHLHLHSASTDIVCKFIEHLPFIISLTIDYLYGHSSSSTISVMKSYVRRLTIIHILSSQIHFEQLLLCLACSSLIQLRVVFDTCDFEQLAHVLTRLSYLKNLHLRVKTFPSNLDLELIRLMNPWFLLLQYEDVVDGDKHKRVLAINTSSKKVE